MQSHQNKRKHGWKQRFALKEIKKNWNGTDVFHSMSSRERNWYKKKLHDALANFLKYSMNYNFKMRCYKNKENEIGNPLRNCYSMN